MTSLDPPMPDGVLRYRVERLEKKAESLEAQLDRIEEKVDRQNARWAAFIFTFSGAMLLLALNLLVMRGGA